MPEAQGPSQSQVLLRETVEVLPSPQGQGCATLMGHPEAQGPRKPLWLLAAFQPAVAQGRGVQCRNPGQNFSTPLLQRKFGSE